MITHDGIKIDIKKAKSRIYYDIFIEYDFEYPTYMNKLCTALNVEHEIYLESFPTTRKYVKETKLQVFQYKVLNNIIATNRNLFIWKIKENELCKFCGETDTLLHCLWECSETQKWLQECIKVWSNNTNNLLDISKVEFLMGCQNCTMNHVFLITKYYIWKTRFYNKMFNVNAYCCDLKHRIIEEKHRLSSQKFISKWNQFNHLYNDVG